MVDDSPYGGGPGMIIKPEPVSEAINSVAGEMDGNLSNVPIILLDPRGQRFNQELADKLATEDEIIMISGNYEGVDERVREDMATITISLGDFVITGGDLASMVIIDAIARRIPGVLGSEESGDMDSFANNLLQYPQYTRPENFSGAQVPSILLSGHHKNIQKWRREQSLLLTLNVRPDLLNKTALSEDDRKFLYSNGWQQNQ
tara:strand:- start:2638 stop:3246 length:609 start_codon:yes stop_codon:yes gene_type:complete